MRIKRILSMALCLVMVCLALVGCEEEIGSYLENYDYQPEKVANMDFDLYIIVGEGTEKNATTTVNAYISNYLSNKFKSRVNINYITADEYNATVEAALSTPVTDKHYIADLENNRVTVGKIVLVNSEDMMDELIESEKAYDLSSFVYNDEYKELFGKLKTQLPEDLLAAAKTEDGKLYAIPNNHIVGKYEYLVFNREAAQLLNYVDTENSVLRQMTTLEDCGELVNYRYDTENKTLYYISGDDTFKVTIDADGNREDVKVAECPSTCENVVTLYKDGLYQDQQMYMDNGYVCNISKTPVCTRQEAFESAFAVIPESEVYYWTDSNNNKIMDAAEATAAELIADKNEVAKRGMQIVNAINADVELRNLLQYGVKGINYELQKNDEGKEIPGYVGEYITRDQNAYNMDLKYTGDKFKAYYNLNTDENEWNTVEYENGVKHNKKVNYYKDIFLKQ